MYQGGISLFALPIWGEMFELKSHPVLVFKKKKFFYFSK